VSSAHADRFNAAARPRLHDVHGETVELRLPDGSTGSLVGIFRRVTALGEADAGVGMQGFTGDATLTVLRENLLGELPAKTRIVRDDVEWVVTHYERQDAWTWVLHLSRPNGQLRMAPEKMRR